MAEQYIWGALNRSLSDSTTVDEAIAEAIDAHNADEEAHLAEDESLDAHRSADVIDHLAESVVNDKIGRTARRYMAIVDPNSESDFDTLAGAVEYCADNGYGDIFIVAGTHYITGGLEIDARISVYGAGQQETIIAGTDADSNYIVLIDGNVTTAGLYGSQTIAGMTLGASSHPIDIISDDRNVGITFEDVYFSYCYEGYYMDWNTPGYEKYYNRCTFAARSSGAYLSTRYGYFNQCIFTWSSGADELLYGYHNKFTDCKFSQSSSYNTYDFIGGLEGECIFTGCKFTGCKFRTTNISQSTAQGLIMVEGCSFDIFVADNVRIDGTNIRFVNNWCRANSSYSPLVVSGSTKCVVTGNVTSAAITNSGTSTVLSGNTTI